MYFKLINSHSSDNGYIRKFIYIYIRKRNISQFLIHLQSAFYGMYLIFFRSTKQMQLKSDLKTQGFIILWNS